MWRCFVCSQHNPRGRIFQSQHAHFLNACFAKGTCSFENIYAPFVDAQESLITILLSRVPVHFNSFLHTVVCINILRLFSVHNYFGMGMWKKLISPSEHRIHERYVSSLKKVRTPFINCSWCVMFLPLCVRFDVANALSFALLWPTACFSLLSHWIFGVSFFETLTVFLLYAVITARRLMLLFPAVFLFLYMVRTLLIYDLNTW